MGLKQGRRFEWGSGIEWGRSLGREMDLRFRDVVGIRVVKVVSRDRVGV